MAKKIVNDMIKGHSFTLYFGSDDDRAAWDAAGRLGAEGDPKCVFVSEVSSDDTPETGPFIRLIAAHKIRTPSIWEAVQREIKKADEEDRTPGGWATLWAPDTHDHTDVSFTFNEARWFPLRLNAMTAENAMETVVLLGVTYPAIHRSDGEPVVLPAP